MTDRKKTRRPYFLVWTDEKNDLLRKLYPAATWEELQKAFPEHKRGVLVQQAVRLGLRRPRKDVRVVEAEVKREPVTDGQIAHFMTRGRSIKEVAKSFKLSEDEVAKRVEKGFEGYDLFLGPKNISGEATYVAVPKSGTYKVPDRAWKWQRQTRDGQPYGVVTFAEDFNHQKIRIIPLDNILHGDSAHDAPRFDAVIRDIARTPNTFCFLNGDMIAEIKGGTREAREELLLERAVEFGERMRPIVHKILWAQQGCLEARSLDHQGFDPLQYFCNKYGVPYFEEPVYIDLFWGRQLFTLWTMHGRSTAQVKGAKMNALRRPAQVHDYTHFIVMGHVGDAMWNRQIKICRSPEQGTLVAREEYHVILNNFTKYFGTKSARRGYTPSSNEAVVLYVYPSGKYHVKTKTIRGGGS